ncbi:pyridine nucleotide-disulfide oxidoreductase [Butyrivibrio sp. CB08]|uniref:FAD-dependent oxidoreductase n=1 Tax=Butyrivibrio sp. CB08 TaxID=2364879 RepID=UPI000EA913F8|nr:FAD-dependent oxidoreductase [Butyrivibrio sp. CB08]RKM61200.1 pyridine nucleotide-disulfide oxidoreductase [Butyrivibrio sp. CB08]
MTKIVVIGAGYAGVLATKKLEKKLRKKKLLGSCEITIIDKHPYHTMLTELHEVAACRVGEESIKMDLKKIFAERKVNVVLDTVTGVDFNSNTVEGKNGSYDYDYLVVAAGSKPTYFGVEGAEEYSYKLWSYDDAVKLRDRIHECFRLAADETDINKKRELLSFYVVGAGFTGVEMVGELAEYTPILCKRFGIDRGDVTIVDVDGLSRPVPILPEKLSNKVDRRLRKMGVDVVMNASVVGVGENFIKLKKGDEVSEHVAGTVIWTAGIESSEITSKIAQEVKSGGRGRIEVDEFLRSVDHENVFVIGDNMLYTAPGQERPVPQMVENAEHSAATVARNIMVDITGEGEKESYNPKFHGVMVCVGGRYGVARGGMANHQINFASFFAMFAKHFINIIYFIQVMGWTKVFSYLMHEFFTIRNNRSFLGGHFSNKTPSFMMVPLRVWLGAVWVFEGVMKIVEGWLQKPMLEGFFGGANSWFDSLLGRVSPTAVDAVSAATTEVADAVASASTEVAAAAPAGTVIFDWNLGLFEMIFVSGTDLAKSTISDFAFKIQVPFVDWIVENIVLSSDAMTMFMQGLIVILQILIGLGLMAGCFTFLSAGVSLVLQAMFVTTTGLYLNTFWMIFAGLAVMFGGGRSIGLDYYLMPWLKSKWKKVKWARKWYLYND